MTQNSLRQPLISPQSTPTDVRARTQSTILKAESPGIVLNEDEERIVEEMLHEERDHLSRVDQEIHRLESIIAGLYEERTTCIGRVDKYALSLTPHKRLPSELLARIFLEVQGGQPVILPPNGDQSPWVLQQVCSQWRKVAQEEGRLWSDLAVVDPPSGKGEGAAIVWIPRLWNPNQSSPVSLSLGRSSARYGGAVCRALAPYFHRIRDLSLYAPTESFPSIFVGHSNSFNALESLVLNMRPMKYEQKRFSPKKGQLVTTFTTSTKLKKATFTACLSNDVLLHKIYELPWGQLTHLTFHMVRLSLGDLESVFRQCNSLVSLTFTSTRTPTSDRYLNKPEILLPHLRSITVILEKGNCYWKNFSLLRVPLLEEITFDNSTSTFRFESNHAELSSLIERSGCEIKSLSLLGSITQWKPKGLLEKLPDLTRLVVSQSRPMPGLIFDMMVKGEILQNLEHLECFTGSPMAFLTLMDHQRRFSPSSERRTISTANIMYDVNETYDVPDTIRERYKSLKPEWECCGKDIKLKEISLDASSYWEDSASE